jgi:hypothetical protein
MMTDERAEEAMKIERVPPTARVRHPGWNDVRRKLAGTDLEYVIGVVKWFFDQSPENRTFLTARLFPRTDWSELLEQYRKRIQREFYTPSDFPRDNPRLSECRRAISDYRKTTGDLNGTADLMLTYVETGVHYTHSFGMDSESFYNSMESVLTALVEIIQNDERGELVEKFRERLEEVADEANDLGYACDDRIAGPIAEALATDEEEAEPEPTPGEEPPSGA